MSVDKVSAAFLRDVVWIAASRGVAPEQLCARAGVDLASLSAPDGMLAGRAASALWAAAVEATADPDLGLALGAAAHPASLGLVAPVLAHAPDLRSALGKLARYSRLLLSAVALELSVRGPRAKLALRVLSPHSYLAGDARQPIECTLAASVVLTSRLIGRPLPVRAVSLRHARPASVDAHRRAFGVEPRFGAPLDAVEFDAAALDAPVLFAAPAELLVHEGRVRAALERSAELGGARARAYAVVAELLRGDAPSMNAVARRLALSPRSLQRALAEEGSSFRAVVDDVRKELALAHLAAPDASIAQVALLLGFSEPRAFHRAFKRWTGGTPRAHAAARAGSD